MYQLLSILAVLVIISTVPFVSSDITRGEFTVPNWVKNIAGWWASDQLPDSAFLQGIQYLVNEGIMVVEIPTEIDSEDAEEVPGWVKNTAGWWAEDKIHDITFVAGIKYLIGKGIMVVEQEVEEAEELVEEVVEIKDFFMELNGANCCTNWAYVGKEYRFQIETFDDSGSPIDGVTITAKIISNDGELRQNLGEVTTEDGFYKNSITIPNMDWYAGNILSVTGEYYGVEKTIEKEFEVFSGKGNIATASSITEISAVDAETNGVNGFPELNGAHDVATFTIGSSTYAIVSSYYDDGVQMIDISDPANIVAKDSKTDGSTFPVLDGANDVATFTISGDTYAIVTAYEDNGVQMIDISDPANIVAKDSKTDGSTFTELNGAYGVATFTIGSSTYAIVTAYVDSGVQIIDISNPAAIVAKDAETDGENGFTELKQARGVDTFTIGSGTYAIVTAYQDDGVQIIDISDPANIVAKDSKTDGENGFTELNGADGVDTFTIGSSTYAIVTTKVDDGVQMIDISDPANIVAIDVETDGVNGFTELEGANDVDAFKCGSRTFAIVTAIYDDSVQIINISNPEDIVLTDVETDGANGFTELEGAGGVDTFTIGSSTYAIVTTFEDDGVQMIHLTGKACS